MRRLLLLAAIIAVAICWLAWRWRAAEPLDLADTGVCLRPEFHQTLGPLEANHALPLTYEVEIGEWAYCVVVVDLLENLGPFDDLDQYRYDGWMCFVEPNLLPRIEKRPLTAIAAIRRWFEERDTEALVWLSIQAAGIGLVLVLLAPFGRGRARRRRRIDVAAFD